MKNYTSLFILIIISFSFLACNKSYATRELPMETAQAAKDSIDIVVAKCISSEVKKDEKSGFIFTYTTFEVSQALKEKYGSENIVLRIVGGKSGDVSVNVPDRPVFVDGEEVVLFLGPKNSAGYPVLHSFNRGVYKVSSDETGNKVISTPISGLNVYKTGSDEKVAQGEKLTLDDFIYSINQAIN